MVAWASFPREVFGGRRTWALTGGRPPASLGDRPTYQDRNLPADQHAGLLLDRRDADSTLALQLLDRHVGVANSHTQFAPESRQQLDRNIRLRLAQRGK